jgi:hypothetical protein
MFINLNDFFKRTMCGRDYLQRTKAAIGRYVDKFLIPDITLGYTPQTSFRYKLLQTGLEILKSTTATLSISVGSPRVMEALTSDSGGSGDAFLSIIPVLALAAPALFIFESATTLIDNRYRDKLNLDVRMKGKKISEKHLPDAKTGEYKRFNYTSNFWKWAASTLGGLCVVLGSLGVGKYGIDSIKPIVFNRLPELVYNSSFRLDNFILLVGGGSGFITSSAISGWKKDISAKVDLQTQLNSEEEYRNGNNLEGIVDESEA